jgi:hypothetical protein
VLASCMRLKAILSRCQAPAGNSCCNTVLLHEGCAQLVCCSYLHNRYIMRLKPGAGHANVTAICNELGGLAAGPRRFNGICNTRLSTVSERAASTSSILVCWASALHDA